jgi:dipeptidyl aminopeptidase/acylaminoacyl peptidase
LSARWANKQLVPIRDLNPSVSPEVADAIERALAVQPEDRWSSAAEFLDALPVAHPTRQPDVRASGPTPPSPTAPIAAAAAPATRPGPDAPAQPRRAWVVPAVVITLVVLGAGGAGLWSTGALQSLFGASGTAATPTALATATLEVALARPTSTPTLVPTLANTATEPPPTPTVPPTDTPILETPTPAATPRGGGSQIAFVSERSGPPQVYLVNVDGSDVTQLTFTPDGACQPEWSPDGQRLLFISPCRQKDDQYPLAAIYIMNADGTNVQQIITVLGGVFDASWSPAGIAFTHLETNRPGVWEADEQGRGAHQVSQLRSSDSQPSWSPSGDKLVFMNTSRAGFPTIFWMFRDGTFDGASPDQVTRVQSALSPAWSPLGDQVAYISSGQIWTVKWDARGFGAVQLTNRGPNADPDWSPDGNWITFESWRDAANHEIYIMGSNGGLQTRLTDDTAADYQPVWRP